MKKSVLVWGAGGGIGSAIASQFLKSDWQVVGIVKTMPDNPLPIEYLEADVTNPFSVEQTIYNASLLHEQYEAWVYAAGEIFSNPIEAADPQVWINTLNVNLSGVFLALHYSQPLLSDDAAIFLLGAVSERMRLPGLSAYAASKAGLEAMVEAVSKEDRRRRYILLRPGAVATKFWDKVPFSLPKQHLMPDDIAQKVVELYESGKKGVVDF